MITDVRNFKPDVAKPRRTHLKVLGLNIELKTLKVVLLTFVITRLMIFFIILLSSTTIPMRLGAYLYSNPDNLVMDGLVRDDSWWYHNIATRGYNMGNIQTGAQGNTAFFPVYPLLVKTVSALVGDVFFAGILVSNVAFLFALVYMYRLARREFDDETAARAVFYFAAAPTAVFFSAMYTESVFMLAILATFYYTREGQWDKAAIAGAVASGTRNTGVIIALSVALEGLYQAGFRFKPPRWKRAALKRHFFAQVKIVPKAWRSFLAAAFVPVGLIGYMAYLANAFGDPLGFIHVQATWGREVSGAGFTKIISDTITHLNIGKNFMAGQFDTGTLLNLLSTLGFGVLVIITLFKLRPTFSIYALLTFLVPLSTGSVGSMTRYILMLIPCFLLLAKWGKNPMIDKIVMVIFVPMMGYMSIIMSHWYFAG
ncbi:glycosyltransferase family 39 protein [Candidatus Chlorohelix sp.]|uniref:glycosyltransferase family 39 protein n=1 Tax=Candidatus Chlorohelix sp. TaxID=3139201 RepID=UPI0030664242